MGFCIILLLQITTDPTRTNFKTVPAGRRTPVACIVHDTLIV